MRNFNTISIFRGANALQFLGGGNSQNEARKTEGEQPRNRQRISNLSLTLVSTFVRYAACIALLLCLGVGQMWGATTAPSDTVTVHSPGKVADGDLVTKWGKKYEVYFSNNAEQTSLLVGSNTASTTQTTGTNKWCNIGSSCGNNNNNISTAFTLAEFVSNVKSSNNKAIRVQSTGASEKNIVMVVSGYDSIAVLAKSNDINVYAEIWDGSSYGSSSALTVGSTSNMSSHYKRQFLIDKTKRYRLTIAYGTSGSTNKDIVAFSLCYTPTSTPTWCTLSYDANGGSGSIPAQDFISGTTVYAPWNCAFSRSGYIFDKWNTETDGTGTSYYPYETFSISANTTLYAQWKPVATSDYYCISIWNADVTGISNFTWWKGNEHVVDLALPNYYTGSSQKHYWVGKDGYPYNSGLGQSNAKSSEAEFWNMPLTASYSTHLEDKAKGVLGRIHVYDKSSYDNLDPQFTPQQWVLMWGAPETSWTTTKMYPSGYDNEWISEVVTLTSEQISSWKYYAGFLKSDGGGAFMWKSKEETFGDMGIYNKNTDTWTSGNVSGNLSAGSTGHFRLWSDATSYDNWRCHFVVDYKLSYNANNGTGAPATVYVPAEGDDSHRTIKLSSTEPTRDGYSFKGWATSSSRASSGTVDYAAGAYITVSADTELFAVWECVTPTIGTDLSTSTVNYYVGASASALTVAATAGGGTVSYQWYSNTANSTTSPTPTSLTTGTSYTPSTASAGTTYYFCVVTNTTGSCSTTATSNITPVTVSRKTPTAYSVTGTTSICSGGNTDITLSGSQVGASYQLEKDGSASGDPVSGTGSALVWNVSATGAYTVSAVQTTAFTDGDMSGTATVSLKTATSVSFSDYTLDATVDDEFEITGISAAGSGTLLYQWYSYSDDEGSGETEIDGAEEESYTFTPDAEGNYYFKCAVTGDCGTVKSDIITVTATVPCSAPSTPSISGTQIYAVGDDIELTATCASGADESTTYTWYKGADWATASASSPVQAASTSGATLTIADCETSDKGLYWCEASNGSGCESHNTTGYSVDVPLGAHTLTYTLNVGGSTEDKSKNTITSTDVSTSSYLKTLVGITNNTGSSYGTGDKKDLTVKIPTETSYSSNKYMSVGFTVEDDYQFIPTSISMKVQPVTTGKAVRLTMTDGVHEADTTFATQSAGSISTVTFKNAGGVAFAGSVTLKIYCYGATDMYRLGSPITISGTIEEIPEEYTISFEGNGSTGGSTASVTNITSGSDVSQITANGFTKTGHDFVGWKTNTALTYVAYGDADDGTHEVSAAVNDTVPDKARIKNVTSDITLTAQWTPQKYDISYKDQGNNTFTGVNIEPYPSKHTYGTGSTLNKASRDSYVFGGWYTNKECTGDPITSLGATDYTAKVYVYAKWTAMEMTALADNTLYKVEDMVPDGVTPGSEVRWYPGVSSNNKFNIRGASASSSQANGGMCPRSDSRTIAGESFTSVYGFRKPASGTDGTDLGTDLPDNHAIQFKISAAGILDIYCYYADSIYLVKDGSSAEVVAVSNAAQKVSKSVTEGTYYLYSTHIGSNQRLYGLKFTPTYTVTLDPDNGNSTSTVTAIYNADMPSKLSDGETDVAVPTFSGYTFGGYYDNHAGAGKQYYTDAVASANTWDKASTATLYAKWTQTVTLNMQGIGSNLSPTVAYKGAALSGYSAPANIRSGALLGYYTTASEGTKVLNADGTFAASNVTDYITDGAWTKSGATTLYAQWETVAMRDTLDISNYVHHGGGMQLNGDTLDYTHGGSNHRDGYVEWKVNVGKYIYNVTTFAHFNAGHKWEVYLIDASGSVIKTLNTFANKYIGDGDEYSETKTWDLTGIDEAGVYIVKVMNVMEWGEPQLLYVAMDPITVTYDANGGTYATTSAYYTGSALTLPTPTRSGYVFEGWYNDSGTKIGNAGASYEPTASITLTAKWGVIVDLPGTINKTNVALYSSDMTWHGDDEEYFDYGPTSGANLGRWAKWEVNVVPGEYTISVEVDFPSPSPDGYQWGLILFDGADTVATHNSIQKWGYKTHTYSEKWDLTQDKAGNALVAGTYTLEVKNIFSNAQPKLKSMTLDVITVTYDANGGSCATESAVYGGSALTLPTPTWSGYTFEGWYSKGTKVGNAGASFTPTQDTTLYAHWTDNISGKVFSYIDNNYGDKFKAFDLSGWVSSNQTGKDKTYTNGTTGVKFVVDDGAWDNKSNSISALAKYKNGSTKDSIIIPTGKIATVKISYGAYYDTEKKKNYGPLTIGGSPKTAVTTVLDDGMTNAQVDAALKEITLSNQQDTLILGSDHDNIFIGRVSAVITGYVITYATGDYGSGDSFTATKTAGSSYTISSTDNAFTRTNCVYDGWSVNADGSTKDYAFGASYTTDAPLTLYPHWVATCATPDDPTGFSAGSITDEGVTFTITDAGDAGNYDIYYSTTSTAPTSSTDATTTATAKSKEVTGLSAGTTFYAWVRAVCDEDHKSDWVALNPGGDTHTFTTHYTVTMGTVTTRKHGDAATGGTISSDVSHAAAGATVTLTATPTSGYAFIAWKIVDGSSVDKTDDLLSDSTLVNPSFTMPDYGVTVNATFAQVHSITYKDHDKTTVLDGLVPTFYLYGIGVPSLPTPTKTGYTFDSWYNAYCVEEEHKGEWDSGCRKSSIGTFDYGSATYYASWTAIDYTITHSDAENGTYTIQVGDASATDETTTANIGQTITLSATPSSGYALSAWNVTSGGEPIEVVDGEFTMPAADVTIAPTFGVVYTVTFNSNGGSAVDAIEQDAPGAAIEMPTAPTKSGYDFVNWMIGGETFDPADSYTPTANITAYATWKAECAASGSGTVVIFDGSTMSSKTSATGTSYERDKEHTDATTGLKYTLNNVKDNLYTTSMTNNTGNGKSYTGCIQMGGVTSTGNYIEIKVPTGSTADLYIVSGAGGGATAIGVSTTKGTAATYYELANKSWSSSGTLDKQEVLDLSAGTYYINTTSDKLVIAELKVTVSGPSCYYVTYDGNGATGGYVNDAAAHENNDFVIVSSNAGGYTRTGNYEFNGWNTKADGSGDDYEYYSYPNDHFTITQDTTLYAQWRIVIDENTSNLTAYEDPAHKDVRVTNGAKLTLTQDTTVRNMLVETGSTLNVAKNGEEGIKLTAKRLSLQGGWGTVGGETKYDMPRVYIDPASKIKKRDTIINFDLAVNNACYYPFALPFDVPLKISAGKDYSEDSCMVDYTHHTLAYYSNYGANGQFAIKTYDGQSRANNGGSSANWKHVAAGATLKAGHGYALTAIALGGIYGEYAVIRFPMKVDNAWLTAGEIGHYTDAKSVEHIKDTVHVTAYKKEGTGEGTGDQTPKANIGWNLLGVPYMACYTTSGDMYNGSNVEDSATLIPGRFNYSTNKWEDGEIMYVTVPVHDFSEYVQADITDSDTKLLPGWCFFVQVAETGNLRFLSASETESSSLPIYAPKREKADMPTVKTGIILSGAETSDKTTILVSDRYSAAEYEINADLEKMFGENSYTLATYSLSGETRLAYNAMSNADAANIIPIGYRVPAEGSYTFDINPRYAQNEAFEHVNLIDYETGFVTDLLQASYTFSSDRTQNDSRFALNVVKIKETPTGIENGADGANDAKGVRKLLLNDKLYIILDNKMYDATGRMVK